MGPRLSGGRSVKRKTLTHLLFELAEAHLAEIEKRGFLPKGKA
jgi:hypothetical protein